MGPDGSTRSPSSPERAARHVAARRSSWRTTGSGTPAAALLAGLAHERAEQAGDQHDEVDLGAGVADPQLDGGHVGARPDVEVDHPGIADRPGRDQLLDHRVVLGAGLDHRGRARRRPAGPDQVAVAGVAGVAAAPVRRAGGDREQRGQVGGDAADDLHGLVAVRDVDVHLRAADLLLVDQHLVLVLHVGEPGAGRDVAAVQLDERHRARRDDAEPVRLRGLRQPARSRCRWLRRSSRVSHTGVLVSTIERCSSGANSSPSRPVEEGVDLGGGLPRLQVDDVELLLGPYPELARAHGRDGR